MIAVNKRDAHNQPRPLSKQQWPLLLSIGVDNHFKHIAGEKQRIEFGGFRLAWFISAKYRQK